MKGFDSLDIRLENTGEQVKFYGDVFRIQILFNNIISNAIKYLNPYTETHYLQIAILPHSKVFGDIVNGRVFYVESNLLFNDWSTGYGIIFTEIFPYK